MVIGESEEKKQKNSVSKKISSRFRTIRSQSQETEWIVITIRNFKEWKIFHYNLSGRNGACSCGQSWRSMPIGIKFNGIFCWNFQNFKTLMQGKNEWFDLSIDPRKFQASSRDQMEDTKSLISEKYRFHHRVETSKIGVFGIWEGQ